MTGFQKILLTLCLLFFVACPLFDKDEDSQNTSLTLSLSSATVTAIFLHLQPEDSLAAFSYNLV